MEYGSSEIKGAGGSVSLEFRSKQRAGEAHLGVMSSRGLAEILGGVGAGAGEGRPGTEGARRRGLGPGQLVPASACPSLNLRVTATS